MIRARNTNSILIVDSTLRDGEQAPGVAFSPPEKVAIATALAEIGVGELEAGTPAMGEQECETIRALSRLRLPCQLTVWCRAKTEDLERAASCGVDGVHLSFPTSEILLGALCKDRRWVLDEIERLTRRARELFDFVSVGAQDASRAEVAFLQQAGQAAQTAGADRLRLADTVGIWNPFQARETFQTLRRMVQGIALGFHGHNDLGMAVGNTLGAIEGGADCIDVTVGGLGERAGNAALEEVAMALLVSCEIDCGLRTDRFTDLCNVVAKAAGHSIHDRKPLVGSNAFTHESGIHVHAMLRDRRSYEPFAAREVGAAGTRFVVGKHSGRTAIRELQSHCGGPTVVPVLK